MKPGPRAPPPGSCRWSTWATPLDIGFNARYLLELLRYMPTDEVRMTFKAPERAAIMQPIGNEDTPDYMCLVMPLRLLS